MSGPLSGLVVFDLTRILAGPSCTQILGDLGAEVIKIERPNVGDDTRNFAPPYLPTGSGKESSESAYFAGTNRNKRSVTLNLSDPEGQAIAKKMIAKADILTENFKTGTLAKYGLDYSSLHPEFPRLIYCSVRALGIRPLCGASGLRRANPRHGWRYEHHRRAQRRADESRCFYRRPHVRHVRVGRYLGSGSTSAPHWRRSAPRHQYVGCPCRVASEPRYELPGDRRKSAAIEQ